MQLSQHQRELLAQKIYQIMTDWQLATDEAISLLGLPPKTKSRHFSRFQNGTPLPDDPLVIERSRHLVGIWEALYQNNPLNQGAGFLWLKRRSRYFSRRTPLEVMLEDGLNGMHRVWCNLDCTQGWD